MIFLVIKELLLSTELKQWNEHHVTLGQKDLGNKWPQKVNLNDQSGGRLPEKYLIE